MGSEWSVPPPTRCSSARSPTTGSNRSRDTTRSCRSAPPWDALRAFTAGSSFVNHDDEAGVLAAGRRADVAVLDADALAAGAGPVGDARVECTIAGGRVVHAVDGAR